MSELIDPVIKTVQIKYKKNEGLMVPQKRKLDAAYDVFAFSGPNVVGKRHPSYYGYWTHIDYIEYRTGLCIEPVIESGFRLKKLFYIQGLTRSSFSKYNLIMSNTPVIDYEYRGEILIRFHYLIQPEDLVILDDMHIVTKINYGKIYKKGDKILQIVPVHNIDIDWIETEELNETERNTGSFGSTGN